MFFNFYRLVNGELWNGAKNFENAATELFLKSAIIIFRDISTTKIANYKILSDIAEDKERTKTTFIQQFFVWHCTELEYSEPYFLQTCDVSTYSRLKYGGIKYCLNAIFPWH